MRNPDSDSPVAFLRNADEPFADAFSRGQSLGIACTVTNRNGDERGAQTVLLRRADPHETDYPWYLLAEGIGFSLVEGDRLRRLAPGVPFELEVVLDKNPETVVWYDVPPPRQGMKPPLSRYFRRPLGQPVYNGEPLPEATDLGVLS